MGTAISTTMVGTGTKEAGEEKGERGGGIQLQTPKGSERGKWKKTTTARTRTKACVRSPCRAIPRPRSPDPIPIPTATTTISTPISTPTPTSTPSPRPEPSPSHPPHLPLPNPNPNPNGSPKPSTNPALKCAI